ncbi:MAG: T9SS type A sorting domain-containing protein [Bacteroidales bacterium]|nr:T9SS type A sorting domain-containing protein [Bacteroidales bacterium]
MKQTQRFTATILIVVLFTGFAFAQKQNYPSKPKDGQTEMVDTRIDNMGYWTKKAEQGLIPVNPPIPIPPAEFTGSEINAKSVKGVMEDSPDVPLTSATNVSESENSIFVDPSDNEFIINSNNSTSWSGGSVGTLYGANYFYSADAGITWSGTPQGAGGTNSGDPATAISLDGTRMYVNFIHSNGGQGVARSTDGGSSWQTAVCGTPPGGWNILDKNHMWIDNGPVSPNEGNLYVAWTGFGNANDSEIEFVRSTDGGVTWSSHMNISSAVNAGSHNQGVNIQTGPNGEVYTAWTIYDSWPQDEKAIGFAKSTNGGSSFTTATRIINNIRGIRNTEVGKNHRVNSFPVMAVDISGGPYNGNIYVVWTNIGVPGVNSGTDADVYMIKSADGGENWSSPMKLNQDASGLGKKHYMPWITCDPETGNLSAIWYDDRNVGTSQCEVYCANSFDGGETWEDFKVSDVAFTPSAIPGLAGGYMGDYLGITARGGLVYPVWTDNRNGIYMAYTSPFVTNSLPKPENLEVALDEATGATQLSWEFNGEDFLYFNVYRNGTLLGTTNDLTYSDNLPDYGVFAYGVTAMHDDGESVAASASIQWGNPHIAVDPVSVGAFLAPGESTTKAFLIENVGELPLEYSLATSVTSGKGTNAYCDASGGCDEYISQVIFGDIDNSSSCDGYADYSNMSTTVNAGESYDITIVNGNTYSSDDLGIWIDWNQDDDFEDAGENVVCESDNGGEGTFTINIPDDALAGETTMRIRIKWSGSDCGSPCGATTYGEVEDYTISVLGWIQVEPTEGTIAPGESENIFVHLDASDLAAGVYTAEVNITSNDPDLNNVMVPVSLLVGDDVLQVTATGDPLNICEGESTQLEAAASGGSGTYTYSWDPEDGLSDPNIATPVATPETTTTYLLSVNDGFSTVTDEVTINVNPLPEVAGTPSGETDMCMDSPNSTYTTSGSVGASSYLWTLEPASAGSISGGGDVGIVDWDQSFAGTATITVAGMNDCGEGIASEVLEVNIHEIPVVTLDAFAKTYDNLPAFELTGGMPEGGEYSGTGVSNGMFDPAVAGEGMHTITYTYSTEFGCENFAEQTIEVEHVSGIADYVNGIKLEIFPNPNSGIFTINLDLKNSDKAKLTILNNQGMEMLNEDIALNSAYSKQFDLSQFAEGLYFIYIQTDESSLLKKIVIRK